MRSTILKITQAFTLSLIYFPAFAFSQGSTDTADDIIRKQESERIQEIERIRQQELDAAYSKRLEAASAEPLIELEKVGPDTPGAFPVDAFVFYTDKQEALPRKFYFLKRSVKKLKIKYANKDSLSGVLAKLTLKLYAKGFVTTRLNLPEQDFKDGQVKIEVILGHVDKLLSDDPRVRNSLKIVLPTMERNILNYRQIENGIDQIERLNSYTTEFQIAPSAKEGFSDIVCRAKRGKSWAGSVSFDDAYTKLLGKHTLRGNYSYDNPFGLADFLSVFTSTAVAPPKSVKRYNYGFTYEIPYGQSLFSANANWNYSSHPIGVNRLSNETESTGYNLDWSILGYRSKYFKSTIGGTISYYRSYKYLDGNEQRVSRKKTTSLGLRYNATFFFGPSSLNATLSGKIGVPWFGSQKDASSMNPKDPTYEYKILNLNVVYTTRGKFFKTIPYNWTTVFNGQHTDDILYSAEQFSIGSRYTVRGFGNDYTISGETGFFVRNELAFPFRSLRGVSPTLYFGIDYGEVSGFSDILNKYSELSGAFVGLRVRWKNLSGNFTWAEPISGGGSRKLLGDRFSFNVSYRL